MNESLKTVHVSAYVEPHLAERFREACEIDGRRVSDALRLAMSTYAAEVQRGVAERLSVAMRGHLDEEPAGPTPAGSSTTTTPSQEARSAVLRS
jgi:hypothetical protein